MSGRVAAAAATAAAIALPQHAPAPAPRRRPVPVTRPSRRDLPGGARALAWIRSLPDHRLLDRLIGGRVWIILIGTLLVGLVTVQLSLLKLNAGIGRAVERSAALEQSNAALRASISELSNSERVVAAATQLGFVVPPQGTPRYRYASANDALAALRVMRVPQQSATTLAATSTDGATTTTPGTTASDSTSATDTTMGVTTSSTAASGTSAPTPGATTAPAPTTTASSGAAGTTSGVALTAGSTAAGGATAPTTGSAG